MGFFRNLFGRKKTEEINDSEEAEIFAEGPKRAEGEHIYRSSVNIHDEDQRTRYIRAQLEQMAEADRELEMLGYEYSLVTAYLTDMEEIESLPDDVRTDLAETGRRITRLEQERKELQGKTSRMTEVQFQKMERIESEMPEGGKKLKDAEDYQVLIKQDLKRLEKDKQAYHIRRNELEGGLLNLKGILVIVAVSLGLCAVVLIVLSLALSMDVKAGYLLLALAAALAMTVVFFRHKVMSSELDSAERAYNRIVQLQNTVKIRLVNNTNLLDYLKVKFQVKDSDELAYLWEQYGLEKEDREKIEKARSDLEHYYNLLVRTLRKYRIQDPNIWIHQAPALYDNKEMVEIRHGLIIRRQKLRSQMEYNSDIAQNAQNEIKELVQLYPEYTKNILDVVAEYERKSV